MTAIMVLGRVTNILPGPSRVKRHPKNDSSRASEADISPIGIIIITIKTRTVDVVGPLKNIASVEGAREGLIDNGAARTDAFQYHTFDFRFKSFYCHMR